MQKTWLTFVAGGCSLAFAGTLAAQTVARPPAGSFRPSGGTTGAASTATTPISKPATTTPGGTVSKPFARAIVPNADAGIADDTETAPMVRPSGSRFGAASSNGATGSGFRNTISDDTSTETDEVVQPHSAPTATRSFTRDSGAAATRSYGASSTTTTSQSPRNVVPARTPAPRVASATPVTTPSQAASPTAESVLKQMLEPRAAQESLPGKPLALSQVIERSGGAGQRIRAVQLYWNLTTKVAAFHAAQDDRALFAQFRGTNDRALAAAQYAAEAAVQRAELDFVTAQNELADAAGLADAQALPTDVPLVSEYRTEFTTLYSSGAAPSTLGRINRAMPYHLKDVRARADAVLAGQQAVQAAAEAVSTGRGTAAELLEVHRNYAAQRSAFATAVFDYNAMIAEYALHVAPNQSTPTVVGMLIKTKPATARSVTPASVRPASAESLIASETADHAPAIIRHEPPQYQAQEAAAYTARNSTRFGVQGEPVVSDETVIAGEDAVEVAPDAVYQPTFRR